MKMIFFLTEVEGVKEFHLDVNKAITEKKLVRTSGESQLSILSNFQHVPPELACVSKVGSLLRRE